VDAGPAGERYDRIGGGYAEHRRPDPRIEALVAEALAGSRSVVGVGSGSGSYEPRGPGVVAVEPSWTMIRQRSPEAAPVVRARAEHLPFATGAFDASLAILTVHHWSDPELGLAELARVSRRQIVLTWDPAVWSRFWLVAEYLPEILANDAGLATLAAVEGALDGAEVRVVPVPWDCTDGFCGAYWRRPEVYLEAGPRNATSGIAQLDAPVVSRAMARLEEDLRSGGWRKRHGHLLALQEIDLGYRLVIASGAATGAATPAASDPHAR